MERKELLERVAEMSGNVNARDSETCMLVATALKEKSLLRRGPFMCTPDHAVDMAYFVSQLELAVEHDMDAQDVGDILRDYATNRMTLEQCLQQVDDFVRENPKDA